MAARAQWRAHRDNRRPPCRRRTVTVITPYFPPERGAPQQRWGELAVLLADEGFSVDVLTNWPHYPNGATYPGYRWRLMGTDEWRGVPVQRIGNFQAAHRGLLPRLVDQLSSSLVLAIVVISRRQTADWVLCEVPPVFATIPALAARLRGSRVAAYVADLWPESPIGMDLISPDGVAARTMSWLTRSLYRMSAAVFTTSEAQRDHCDRLTASPCYFMPSAVDTDRFPVRSVARGGDSSGLRLLYMGTFGLAHGLEHVIAAAADFPEGTSLVLVGDGAERERILEAARTSQGDVVVTGPVAPAEVPALLAGADVGIVSLRRVRAFEGVLPSKLFEYLAAGLAVLVVGEGEVARLVMEEGLGAIAAPEDPAAIAEAVHRLASLSPEARDRIGQRGRALVESRHSRRSVARRMAAVLREPDSQPGTYKVSGPAREPVAGRS